MVSQLQIKKTIERLRKELQKYRKTTLNREAKNYTPFQTLISCILSLRTRDETTEKVSKNLFEVADTPEKILKLTQKKLEKLIFSSGHYRKKAETIKRVSKILLKKYEGKVPDTEEDLLKINGVGRKTSNIVLCLAYGKQVLPIDTHCHRIPNRLGWIKTENPEETEKELMNVLPKDYWMEFNGLFVLFGKKICLPISPLCTKCPVSNLCRKIGVEKNR